MAKKKEKIIIIKIIKETETETEISLRISKGKLPGIRPAAAFRVHAFVFHC